MAAVRLDRLVILLILAGIDLSRADLPTFNCSNPFVRITATRGYLQIDRNVKDCGFLTKDNTINFAIRTEDLQLKSGDKLTMVSEALPDYESKNFVPPFDAGYIIYGKKDAKITFSFDKQDATSMLVEFMLDTKVLSINGDINNNFEITPVGTESIQLEISKTVEGLIHLEAPGAKIDTQASSHKLIKDPKETVSVMFNGDQPARIQTSPVYQNCSGYYESDQATEVQINGPDVSASYKCVNIFRTKLPDPTAHFEVDFANFIDLVDLDDHLYLSDGSALTRVNIIKSVATGYEGRTLTFQGRDLVVIYERPHVLEPSKITFKLSVRSKQYGGILDKPGPLVIPSSGVVSYVLHPAAQQYAAVSVPGDVDARAVNITVKSGDKIIASLKQPTRLPPNIVLNEKSIPMILDIAVDAKAVSSWTNKIQFKSLENSCHKIASDTAGSFSVTGPPADKEGCQWLLASSYSSNLMIGTNDWASTDSCLTIQSLDQEKAFFHECNINRSRLLPTFNLRQAYITVKLSSKNNHFDGLYSPASSLDAGSGQETCGSLPDGNLLSSPGYPISYSWSSSSSQYVISKSAKNCVITVTDLDIREGEKITIDKVDIDAVSDFVSAAKSTEITITRSASTTDFKHRRGFDLVTKQFEEVITADLSKSSLTIPKNLTSVYIKISAATSGAKTFSQRIAFNLSITDPNLFVYDSRSMQSHHLDAGQNVTGQLETYRTTTGHYTSTSDTVVIAYHADQGKTLPELTIDYKGIACNSTSDHICDHFTRCVPAEMLCKGQGYCDDGSDIKTVCESGPAPQPKIVQTGVSGITVFILCMLMLILGAVGALYGPDLFKTLENRFRSGRYTTFSSTE